MNQRCYCRATSSAPSGAAQEAWDAVGRLSSCLDGYSSSPPDELPNNAQQASGSSDQAEGSNRDKEAGSSGRVEGSKGEAAKGRKGDTAKGSSSQAKGKSGDKATGSSSQATGRQPKTAKGNSGQPEGSKRETAEGSKTNKAKGSSSQRPRQKAKPLSAHQGTRHATGIAASHSQATKSANNNSAQQVSSSSGRGAQPSSHHASGRSDPSSATRVVDKPSDCQCQAVQQTSDVIQLPGLRAISGPSQRTRSAADVHKQGSTSFGEVSARAAPRQRQQTASAQGQVSSSPGNGTVRRGSPVVPRAGSKRASTEPVSDTDVPNQPSQPEVHASQQSKPGIEQPAAVTFPFKLLHLKGGTPVPASQKDPGTGRNSGKKDVSEGAGAGPSAGAEVPLAVVPIAPPASLHDSGRSALPAAATHAQTEAQSLEADSHSDSAGNGAAEEQLGPESSPDPASSSDREESELPAAPVHTHIAPAPEVSEAGKHPDSAAGVAAAMPLDTVPSADPASVQDRESPVLPAAPVHAHSEPGPEVSQAGKQSKSASADVAYEAQLAHKASSDPPNLRNTGLPTAPTKAKHAHAESASKGLEAGKHADSAGNASAEEQLLTTAGPEPAGNVTAEEQLATRAGSDPASISDGEMPAPPLAPMHEHREPTTQGQEASRQADLTAQVFEQSPAGDASKLPTSNEGSEADEGCAHFSVFWSAVPTSEGAQSICQVCSAYAATAFACNCWRIVMCCVKATWLRSCDHTSTCCYTALRGTGSNNTCLFFQTTEDTFDSQCVD